MVRMGHGGCNRDAILRGMPAADEPTIRALRRVRRTLDDASASLTQARVLALCSGGIDSTALVALLARLPRGAAPASIHVLHLDHGVRRGACVEREQLAASTIAEQHGLRFYVRQRDPSAQTGADGGAATFDGGAQADARAWRYGQALALAHELGCDVVATGHTADDQLEGALLGLVGVTASEPATMRVCRPLDGSVRLVRPMLGISRDVVGAISADLELVYADDPSNADPDAYLRNAIRHRVVPPLLDVHPAAGMVIARSADRGRERSAAVDGLAQHVLATYSPRVGDPIDVRRLAELEGAARRAVIAAFLQRELAACDVPARTIDARLVRAVDALATRPGRAACARVDVAGDACVRRTGYDLNVSRPSRPLAR